MPFPTFCSATTASGTFAESALTAGVAVPESGRPISGMGTDFQDYDNDGWEDIHLTGISGETFPLFQRLRRTAGNVRGSHRLERARQAVGQPVGMVLVVRGREQRR